MRKRNVPFFNYQYVFKNKRKEFIKIFDEVCSRGAFIAQNELTNFEKNLAEFCGSKFAVGVGNATDALEMLLSAAEINENDEVIFCSHTMVATASAIYANGAIPVPVEAGYDHLIDPESIEKAITHRTKVIMPTHLNGRTCDMDKITELADKYNLTIIEDSAQALGSRFKNQHAGTFGVGGCISFYPAKVLGCLGDGGAVLCNDDATHKKILMMRDHGRNPLTGDIEIWGRNSRLDNIQAAFLDFQLKEYEKIISRRREIAQMYQERLRDIEYIKLPPAPNSDKNHFDVFQNYEIEAEKRDKLQHYLLKNGVGTMVQWGGKAVHQLKKLGFTQSLPNTEKLMNKSLMIPMNMSLSDDDVEYVCEQIISFYL